MAAPDVYKRQHRVRQQVRQNEDERDQQNDLAQTGQQQADLCLLYTSPKALDGGTARGAGILRQILDDVVDGVVIVVHDVHDGHGAYVARLKDCLLYTSRCV